MYWIYNLPNWLFSLICIGAFAIFGLAGLLLSRRHIRRLHRINHSHNDIVSYFLAAVSVFYGITLGLLAVATWTNFSDVDSKVDREAQALSGLARDVGALPNETARLVHTDISRYLNEVIHVSWQQQRKGLVPSGENAFVDRLQLDLMGFDPKNSRQQMVQSEAYHQFNEFIEARRARLDSVQMGMPACLWALVISGALITILVTLFFDVASLAMHLWMTLLLSGLLGLMVFMTAALDNPFRGNLSVTPDALELVYGRLSP